MNPKPQPSLFLFVRPVSAKVAKAMDADRDDR